jgi:hypothetical protein
VRELEAKESVWTWLHHHRKHAGVVALGAAFAMMLVQQFRPFPEAISRVVIVACEVVFYAAALVSVYFRFVYRPALSSQAAEARNTPEAEEFWAEVRRRRRLYLLTWVGWLVAGPLLWKLYSFVVPRREPMVAGVLALVTWCGVWVWTGWRLVSMKCFHCGHRAFDSPFFLMRRAKCSSCGTPYNAPRGS